MKITNQTASVEQKNFAHLTSEITAKKILEKFMAIRRHQENHKTCKNSECEECQKTYLPKILTAVENFSPVSFVLPAFPGKSPNPEKVLGALPDYAEWMALKLLGKICQEVKDFYPPGIKIIICSDGRVFSDVVGMNENDVTAYHRELNQFIKELGLTDISMFNLDDHYDGNDFVLMRETLMRKYGKGLDFLKEKTRNNVEARLMYCGITRFMYEDSMHKGQTKSRAQVQKESRVKAYQVIQRSNAWSDFIADFFPEAIRLSIHPQACGSEKLGIRFLGNETWITPWHGVAVETNEGFVFLKKSEAESLGAKLVNFPCGRPSHFILKGIL